MTKQLLHYLQGCILTRLHFLLKPHDSTSGAHMCPGSSMKILREARSPTGIPQSKQKRNLSATGPSQCTLFRDMERAAVLLLNEISASQLSSHSAILISQANQTIDSSFRKHCVMWLLPKLVMASIDCCYGNGYVWYTTWIVPPHVSYRIPPRIPVAKQRHLCRSPLLIPRGALKVCIP